MAIEYRPHQPQNGMMDLMSALGQECTDEEIKDIITKYLKVEEKEIFDD